MQEITIIGRLGRDAAIRETQNGDKIISFVVAVNGKPRGVEKTSWYDVSTFDYNRYKNMVKYLTKGSNVVVVGELDADLEEGKDGVTRCRRYIKADSIMFNGGGSSGNTSTTTEVSKSSENEEMPRSTKKKTEKVTTTKTEVVEDNDSGDDLPF